MKGATHPRTMPPSAWCSRSLGGESLSGPDRLWLVVDVETTGLNPEVDRLLEVAVVEVGANGGSRRNITWHERDGDSALAELVEAAAASLPTAVFVAHNARFDLAFLEADMRTRPIVGALNRWLCTLNIGGRVSLAALAASVEVENVAPHTAAGDAQTLALILERLIARAVTRGLTEVAGIAVSAPIRRSHVPSAMTEAGWPTVAAALPLVVPTASIAREQRTAFSLVARDVGLNGPGTPGGIADTITALRDAGLTRIQLLRLLTEAGASAADLDGWADALPAAEALAVSAAVAR